MTPSGFNIGIILKINFSRRSFASWLSVSVKNSITPHIIQDPTVSPG
jgi:hypothetical protein